MASAANCDVAEAVIDAPSNFPAFFGRIQSKFTVWVCKCGEVLVADAPRASRNGQRTSVRDVSASGRAGAAGAITVLL